MDSFGDDSLSDLLVDYDSDWSFVDVENSTSVSVVVLEWHTLVDGTIDNDVDDISSLEGSQGFGNMDWTVLFESLSELMSSFSSVSVAVSHL